MHRPQWQNCLNVFLAWLPWSGRPFCVHAARCCSHRASFQLLMGLCCVLNWLTAPTLEENTYFCSSLNQRWHNWMWEDVRGAGLFWRWWGSVYGDGILLLITNCQTIYFSAQEMFWLLLPVIAETGRIWQPWRVGSVTYSSLELRWHGCSQNAQVRHL